MPFSKGSSGSRDQTRCLLHLLHWQENSLPLVPPGKLLLYQGLKLDLSNETVKPPTVFNFCEYSLVLAYFKR